MPYNADIGWVAPAAEAPAFGDYMPWKVLILPTVEKPFSAPQGTWVNTLDITNETATFAFNNAHTTDNHVRMFWNSTGAQNDEVVWKVPLSAGTWTVRLYGRKSTNCGIATVKIDDVAVGTIDTYGSASFMNAQELTDIVVASDGIKSLSFLMATKNASSSGYYLEIEAIELVRTA